MIPCYKFKNGAFVPMLGLGTYLMKEDEAENCVRLAVEAGYRSVDTAMFYFNEEGVGKGIKTCGTDRSELYVTTKLWNDSHGYEKTLKAFDASLKRLGLDYIDQYLIHWPLTDDSYLESWRAFEKLYEDGLIRVIGVSNFLKTHLNRLLAECNIAPMVNQIEVNPVFQPNDLIGFCRQNGILVEAWRPIVWGKLSGMEPVTSAAAKYGKSPVQVVLKWLNMKGIRAIAKASNEAHMRENLDIFDFELAPNEAAAIDALNIWTRTGESPDEFCLK